MLHCYSFESKLDLPGIAAALPQTYPYLLDSAAPGPLGEYSMLLRSSGEQLCLHASGEINGPGHGEEFLPRLNDWYQRENQPQKDNSDWPFSGGWFI